MVPKWLQKSTFAPKVTLGCTLVTFWLPFGALWLTFNSLWLPFGAPWLAFGNLWLVFGALWLPFGTLWFHFVSFWLHYASFWIHFAAFSLLWFPFGTLFALFSLLLLILRFVVDVPFLIYKAQHARPVVACDVDPPPPASGRAGTACWNHPRFLQISELFRLQKPRQAPPLPPTLA